MDLRIAVRRDAPLSLLGLYSDDIVANEVELASLGVRICAARDQAAIVYTTVCSPVVGGRDGAGGVPARPQNTNPPQLPARPQSSPEKQAANSGAMSDEASSCRPPARDHPLGN